MSATCAASASYGDYVCCLPEGHQGIHECRNFALPGATLWAAWDDHDGDGEPYACSHEEMDHLGEDFLDGCEHVRCTRCGVVYRQIDDPKGNITLTSLHRGRWVNRKIRYEEVD